MDQIKLLETWEPQILKLSNNYHIAHLTPEDIAQELRLHLIHTAKFFNQEKEVTFHTYLYCCLSRKIMDLYRLTTRIKRPVEINYPDMGMFEESRVTPNNDAMFELIPFWDMTDEELVFVDCIDKGFKKEKINELTGGRYHVIKRGLIKKCQFLLVDDV